MTQTQQLQAGIAALEAQRGVLGDTVVDTALAPLRARLAALANPQADTTQADTAQADTAQADTPLALAAGQIDQALQRVDEVLAQVDAGATPDSAEGPFVELVSHRVLSAAHDPRAAAVLERAHADLQQRAARIADAALRSNFLNAVPAHREIVDRWTDRRCSEPA